MTADCYSLDQLSAFHMGVMPDEMLDALAEHLEACAECTAAARASARSE